MSSIFGNIFKISTWGESHGKGVGVVIDGCPAGISLNEEDIQLELDKRKPNNSRYATKRNEEDEVIIMSGVFEDVTTGTPISIMVLNKDFISSDYSDIKDIFRPSHADYTYYKKYGTRDYRGGGRASGRETVARVCAGAVAKKVLSELGVNIVAYTSGIGGIKIEEVDTNYINLNLLRTPCKNTIESMKSVISNAMKDGNSVGGSVCCEVSGLKAGIGEPVFGKLDGILASAIMSIGGTKGVEFGKGFLSISMLGSDYNDGFYAEDGQVSKKTNNSGGILGGITDGSKIKINVAFKPTPSISIKQHTVDKHLTNRQIEIKGRHDPCIVPRAVVVVEAMVSVVLVDYILISLTNNIHNIKKYYDN